MIGAVFDSREFIPVVDAARICGMNRNSFSEMFKRVMGLSFPEFALRHRVSGAARGLSTSDDPVKRVAANWGFTDTSHLNRCFMKYFSRVPSDYRGM